ncbi:hypothetical protein KGF54_004073 [Candida jiufengensis]|uniref:uncharacterized protein n=1 Tax=Candida jiufengensis TaxID=497108 RepID=UPI002225419E|nr:uncharacterized protein KGF54_004073 [Candida jiufengensis]KAI5950999.1 hypothetical protein KGF54_004073 [Candida jiufengensis]
MRQIRKMYNGYAIELALSLFGFTAGMEMYSYISLKNFNIFATFYKFPTKIEENLLKSSNVMGAIGGGIIGGEIAEHFGFLKALKCLCLVWIIGVMLCFISESIPMLIIGKAIKGVAIGISTATIPVYQHEIIPSKRRGRMLTLFIFSTCLGNCFMFILPMICLPQLKGFQYLILHWLIDLIPLSFASLAILFVPESPKFLAENSKWSRAADVIESIEANNSGQVSANKLNSERGKLGDKHFVIKKYPTANIKTCSMNNLFGKKYIKEISTGILLQLLVDFIGITKLVECFNYICFACQIKSLNELKMVQTFDLVIRTVFMLVPILIIDAMRRKDVFVFDWVLKVEFFDETASLVLALTIFMDIVCNAIVLPSCWLFIIENFSSTSRMRGWVVITSLHWLFECSLSLIFPFLLSHLNGWLFFIIVFICLFGTGFSCFITETKDKSYIEACPRSEPIEKPKSNELRFKDTHDLK